MVLRYCRLFWPCLLSFGMSALSIGHGVTRRAVTMSASICSWVKELYREVTDGGTGLGLGRMVKIIIGKIGRIELSNRWYRHRYPRRFGAPPPEQHNLSQVN
jgi:hypothetical protein